MNKLNKNLIAVALSCAFSAGAMAQTISSTDYKVRQDKITADYNAAKANCSSLAGNANDICVADAKGKQSVAKAELEHANKPTMKTQYDVNIAKADAAYSVAKERCDDLSGNAKDVCLKQAKATETAAKAEAKVQAKTTDANIVAGEKGAEARQDATVEKMDAEYSVAKEKCDSYSGNAKDTCLNNAKARFGK